MNSLKSLIGAIAEVETQLELQQTVISQIGEYFAAKRYRLFLLSQLPTIARQSKLFWLATSTEHNPVLRYLVEHHAPIHEEVFITPRKMENYLFPFGSCPCNGRTDCR